MAGRFSVAEMDFGLTLPEHPFVEASGLGGSPPRRIALRSPVMGRAGYPIRVSGGSLAGRRRARHQRVIGTCPDVVFLLLNCGSVAVPSAVLVRGTAGWGGDCALAS